MLEIAAQATECADVYDAAAGWRRSLLGLYFESRYERYAVLWRVWILLQIPGDHTGWGPVLQPCPWAGRSRPLPDKPPAFFQLSEVLFWL